MTEKTVKVVCDPESNGLYTAALAVDWKLPDICQVVRCKDSVYAILVEVADYEIEPGVKDSRKVVICKVHYEEMEKNGGKFSKTIKA